MKAKVDSTHKKLKGWYRITKEQVSDSFLKLEARLKEQKRKVLAEVDQMARSFTARVRRFNEQLGQVYKFVRKAMHPSLLAFPFPI